MLLLCLLVGFEHFSWVLSEDLFVLLFVCDDFLGFRLWFFGRHVYACFIFAFFWIGNVLEVSRFYGLCV